MFIALISTFLGSIATIFWKKSLVFWVSKELFNLLSKSSIVLVTIVLYLFWYLDFSGVNYYYISLLLLITIIWVIKTLMNQYIYSREKISTLMPYTNINKILSIVLAFFIFWDISVISFIITLIAIAVIITFTIDFKSLKFPKTIILFAFWETVQSILTLLTWYILLNITWSAFFVISYIIWIIFIWSIVLYKWQLKELSKIPTKFYIYRLTACHLWWIWFLLTVLVIKDLWISISILLSFLWMWMTLFLSLLVLKDKPSIKNVFLIVIVSSLVWLWYYFK